MKYHSKAIGLALAGVLASANLPSVAVAEETPALPQLLEPVAPEYPRAARRRNIEGRVILKITVNAEGTVDAVEILEADRPGVFDKAAIAAAKKWLFEAGKPTDAVTKTLNFKIEG